MGNFDPAKHHRRSIRLKGFDNRRDGAYFVTICSHQRDEIFGHVRDGLMHPNRLGEIVRAFKSFSAHRINAIRRSPGVPVWQRNYYEHVFRDNVDWERIHNYIQANPCLWEKDQLNPNLES